jgi:predicted secreted protein
MTEDIVLKTMDLNPKQYRLCKKIIVGHIFETVLQGLFYWNDDKGNAGSDWIDIPTVAEIME